jgi:GntR family frlABCD operon transcriptional regulator
MLPASRCEKGKGWRSMLTQTGSTPLYEQLKQTIVGTIMEGEYAYGDRLPGELDLATTYGVSRITVRRALSELADEGYLESKQGRGTFVQYRHINRQMRSFGGFSETTRDAIKNKKTRILSKMIVEADLNLADKLQVEPGTRLLHLKRVMSDDEVPYLLDNAWFLESLYPGLIDEIRDNVSTFELAKQKYGIVFAKAFKTISVMRAGTEHAELLKCMPGDPLFSITKVIRDPADVPVHYSHYFVMGDRCVYTLEVSMDQADMEVRQKSKGAADIE